MDYHVDKVSRSIYCKYIYLYIFFLLNNIYICMCMFIHFLYIYIYISLSLSLSLSIRAFFLYSQLPPWIEARSYTRRCITGLPTTCSGAIRRWSCASRCCSRIGASAGGGVWFGDYKKGRACWHAGTQIGWWGWHLEWGIYLPNASKISL